MTITMPTAPTTDANGDRDAGRHDLDAQGGADSRRVGDDLHPMTPQGTHRQDHEGADKRDGERDREAPLERGDRRVAHAARVE